jgi:hypothetical protein
VLTDRRRAAVHRACCGQKRLARHLEAAATTPRQLCRVRRPSAAERCALPWPPAIHARIARAPRCAWREEVCWPPQPSTAGAAGCVLARAQQTQSQARLGSTTQPSPPRR